MITTNQTVVIERKQGLFNLDLAALWQYRELFFFLVWRDLKVRYKQTAIGIGWVVLQPVISMAIFTVIFGMFARIPSDGMPYPLFAFSALLPWNYFASALQRVNSSVVGDASLITKVYFPRIILPVVGSASGVVDFATAFILLLGMMIWYEVQFTWLIMLVPLFLLFALLTALAVGLWCAALNVRFRDFAYAMPFLVQIWMFISPVVYPVSIIPEKYRLIYGLNPMTGVIEGFRWALLGNRAPDFTVLGISAVVVLVIFVGGLVFFRNMERTFADVV